MIQSFCFFPVVGNPFAIIYIYDSYRHTNEGPFSEAHGAVTDDCFTDRATVNSSKLKGGLYVVDDSWRADNSVVSGAGEQLHHGRVYSHSVGNCCYRGAVQHHSGAESPVAIWARKPDKEGVRLIRS